jgi:hypothetical protein
LLLPDKVVVKSPRVTVTVVDFAVELVVVAVRL